MISKTFGWDLPYTHRTREFFLSCQKSDGAFYAPSGTMDQNSPLAKLYNTVQSVVALRLLGSWPGHDPMPVINYFFDYKHSGLPFKKKQAGKSTWIYQYY